MGRSGQTATRRRPTVALQRALAPETVEERAHRGRRQRKLLGLIPYGDWSQETSAQSFLRWHGPASAETRQLLADKSGVPADELIHPLLTELTLRQMEVYRRGEAQHLRDGIAELKARWDKQGRRFAPWDGQERQWQAIVEAAALLQPALAKQGIEFTVAELEEKLAAPIAGLNRSRGFDCAGLWTVWLNTAGIEVDYSFRKTVAKRADKRLGELAVEISAGDYEDARRVADLVRRSGLTRSLETFSPYRELLLGNADKARTIFGWLDGSGSAEYTLTLWRAPGQQAIASVVGEALHRIGPTPDGAHWLLEPNALLGGRTPAELLREDVYANGVRVVDAAAA